MGKLPSLLFFRYVALGFLSPALTAVAGETDPMDQQVLLRIERQLRSDIRLRDASLEIQVMAGQATLRGELPSFFERSRLERICRRIDGVHKVINRVTIAPVPETDRDLRRAVEQRMAADPVLHSSEIGVETDGTIVTLSGTAASLHDRRRAQWVAEQIRGVSRVRNELTLGRPNEPADVIPDGQISASIREVLGKDDRWLMQPIEFAVQNGVVTLDGEVSNLARKRFYRYLVERIGGVREVVNQLEVRFGADVSDQTRASMNDAAFDVQIALNAAELVPGELGAKLAGERIAIVGTLPSLATKQQIIRLARAFASGFPVVDEMEVAVAGRESELLQAELEDLLQTDVLLADALIDVTIDQHVATLMGSVDRFGDKVRAERLASTVKGIRSINNLLSVDWTATVSDHGLRTRVAERLQRNRITSAVADAVEITVEQGEVSLSGRVPSWELRRRVGSVASATDGIRSIENRLVVESTH